MIEKNIKLDTYVQAAMTAQRVLAGTSTTSTQNGIVRK